MDKISQTLTELRGQRVYFDTNGLIFFFEKNPRYFKAVATLIQAVDRGECFGYTGDAAVSELMVYPYRTKSATEIARGKAFFARKNFMTVLGHDSEIFDTAAQLRAQSSLRLIDALHYATAIRAGCRYFVTHDKDFNAIESSPHFKVLRLTDLV